MPETANPTDYPPPKAPVERNRNHTLLWFTCLIIVVAICWFLYWFFYLQYHESTDDAYANGNFITINSAINGSVIGYYADDTDLVDEGQLLVQLDPTHYQLTYEKELAVLASVVLQVRQLYNTVEANQALVENKRALLSKAAYDYENRSHLVGSQAVSNEDFIHSQDNYLIAKLDLKQAEAQYQVSVDAVGSLSVHVKQHPLVQKQMSIIRTAYYNLMHCSIYAPSKGYVAQRAIDVGQWVTPTTPLMSVIPENYVWVDANFKETQLSKMRIGQPATVWFDLYGSKVQYEGKVIGIASGSGSVFSLIPPQNATGNWIKIVQRLPVRISLDPKIVRKFPVRLGISAEVDVDISNTILPMLATTPPTKPVSTTNVFDIHFEKINLIMDNIIRENTHDSQKRDNGG